MGYYTKFFYKLKISEVLYYNIQIGAWIFFYLYYLNYILFSKFPFLKETLSQVEITSLVTITTLIVFILSQLEHNKKEALKQEGILKQTLIKIRFLLKRGGHISYFKKCVDDNKWPHYTLLDIELNQILTNIAEKINFRETINLQEELIEANDKIAMLNLYQETQGLWEKIKQYNGITNKSPGGYLLEALDELEHKLRDIKEKIEEEFRIRFKH